MNQISNLFKKIEESNSDELCAVNFVEVFKDISELHKSGESAYNERANSVLEQRDSNERYFHDFMKNQLFAHIMEMKHYSTVDISNSRRIVAVSQDCISMIQILIRDRIHLIVNFRSSDFDNALPVDMKFICGLPAQFISFLTFMTNTKGFEEIDVDFIVKLTEMEVELNLTFGSLHRT